MVLVCVVVDVKCGCMVVVCMVVGVVVVASVVTALVSDGDLF